MLATALTRWRVLGGLAAIAGGAASADALIDLHLPGGNPQRPTTDAFPDKIGMILQRSRPPLLATPLSVFDRDVITPNEHHYVRWHWAYIPTAVDVETCRLILTGHVERSLSIPLAALLKMPRTELVAVNHCSGNSRGFFQQRVPGGQ